MLEIYTNEEKLILLCEEYWSHDLSYNWTYRVSYLMNKHNLSKNELPRLIKQYSTYNDYCIVDKEPVSFKNRSELESRKIFPGSKLYCTNCYYIFGKRNIQLRSLLNNKLIDFYNKLILVYPNVFVNIAPNVFIDYHAINHLTNNKNEYSNEDFFYKTRFNFIVCDSFYVPIFAIDHREIFTNKEAVKKRFLDELGIKYFLLPESESMILDKSIMTTEYMFKNYEDLRFKEKNRKMNKLT